MALFDLDMLQKELLPPNEIEWFKDIPSEQRKVSDAVKTRLTQLARRWVGYEHKPFGDSYGEFFRNLNQCNFGDLYINRRNALMDYVFYDIYVESGKYTDGIISLIRMICDEDNWCYPAHMGSKPKSWDGPVLDLFAAETCSALAVTYKYLKDTLPKELLAVIYERINQRMFVPYTESDDYWWMGVHGNRVNNWNPWINSNVTFCAAMVCSDVEQYRRIVKRACSLTENYFKFLSDDFLCDEGVRYWNLSGACLFDYAELMYDLTGGMLDVTVSEQVKGACSYITGMYDEHGLPANFADATIEFYPDCALLARAGKRTENRLLEDMGRALYRPDNLRSLHDNFYRQLKNIYTASHIQPLERIVYPQFTLLRSINICTMRKNGFFACLKGNHNGECHNHNDVGSFVVYYDGTPVFIDPGVDLYSGYTFSEWRNKLWYMRSEYHNLPVIRGNAQGVGKKFAATPLRTDEMYAQTDISGAYEGNVAPWIRSMDFSGDSIVITDLSDEATESELHYILYEMPTIEGNTLNFSCGVKARLDGVKDIRLESLDITGAFPPDGIVGDVANRRADGYSVLIPRLFIKQWKKDTLYRLVCIPTEKQVTLTVTKA
ncbi:MAG: heparinase II/III family protein [Clostridia bacterium]|nr:heparinase II/III family protein [Clostridia bacterium]